MPNTLLLENGVDRFLLEDGSGFLLMEVPRCYFDVVMADNPVSYWRHGEPSGSTTAADVLGTNPGTYTNAPTLGVAGALTGDTNTAATFAEASDQYVTVPHSTSLAQGNGPLSWECWITRTTVNDGTSRHVMMKGAAGTSAPDLLIGGGSNAIGFRSDGWGNGTASTIQLDQIGVWYHVVATKTAGNVWGIYVNGVDVSDHAPSTTQTSTDANPLLIGRKAGSALESFDGSIDEVAIYNTVLTPVQVQTHYNSARAGCARHFGPIVLQAMNRAATR